jgi:hypothetical protein
MATGNFIMFLDSDDLMDPECIKKRQTKIESYPNKDFYVFPVALFNDELKIVDFLCSNLETDNDLEGFLRSTGGWHTSSSVFENKFLKENLRFNEEALSWQDVEFHIRVLLKSNNYIKFKSEEPDIYVRLSNHPRISNSFWDFNKLRSRIKTIFSIEDTLPERHQKKYSSDLLKFYFYFLEISAKKLNQSEFENVLEIWQKSKNYETTPHSKALKNYLVLHNFLTRNRLKALSFTLYKSRKIIFRERFHIPQKRKKLKNSFRLEKRIRHTEY